MNTDERKAYADALVSANGTSPESIRRMAKMLAEVDDRHSIALAKWHIKRAIRRRNGEVLATWGGPRPNSGRPAKVEQQEDGDV